MNLRANYQKFKRHFKTRGVFYAFWRGVKYCVFLIKRQRDRLKQTPKNVIVKDRLKIVLSNGGINIFWRGIEVTKGMGLSVAINTLGLWTDSSNGDWQIIDKGKDYFKVKLVFRDLPLNQIWDINIKDEKEIHWQIDTDIEEWLYIDEFRIVCLVNSRYKTAISNYQQADFPRLDNNWHDLYLNDNYPVSLVGVRFPVESKFPSSFILETSDKNWFSLIQNSPLNINAHIIGFRHINSEEKKNYSPGHCHLFTGKINLYEYNYRLDTKIEGLRQSSLRVASKGKLKSGKSKPKLKVLLVNLPWQRDGRWGVRAGSRWPHIKDRSEGNYLPFPFFLAYAASLLQKHNIKAHIIDAIAGQMPEDTFIEKILDMNFDYLVAETSIPSFYDDLKILERIHKAGTPIILCGPNSEIYKLQFLKEYSFIDFVLYGEYEFSLLELIQCLQENRNLSKVNGLIYRMNKEVIKNSKQPPFDINLLPWPDREQLPMDKYWDLPGDIPHPSAQILASRGCPFGCNFCLWPQVMYQGNLYRTRDIKDVVDEMEYLVKEKGFKSAYFDDDTFNIGKERMLRFCQAIKERDLQKIPWAIMARPDLMDGNILTEMKSAGLWAVKYGVESVSERLLRNCQKNMNFRKTNQIIKMTKNLGIKVHLTFAFGITGETKSTIQKTIDYALRLEPTSVQFTVLTPFPGTKLFEELDKQGRILVKDWAKYDGHYHCVFQPDNLTHQDLERAKGRAYQLWGEYQRKRQGFLRDIKKFREYLRRYGFRSTLLKTLNYLEFVWIKRKRYLNGED